ncbi:MAG TPA: hypothetical protein VGB89_16690 [Bacteroidota bacterium]
MTTPINQKMYNIIFASIATLLSVCLWGCDNPGGAQRPNNVPETRIANVPLDDSIAQYIGRGVIPEFTLHWLGDDNDGYVVAYRYRWMDDSRFGSSTTPYTTVLNISQIAGAPLLSPILIKGTPRSVFEIYNYLVNLNPADPTDTSAIRIINDSVGTQRSFAVPYATGPIPGDSIVGSNPIVNQSPTRGTFIFSSLADSNLHSFEVAAIDDNNAVDPTPALVRFWTLPAPEPRAIIVTGPVNDQLTLFCITDTWPGLPFTFAALDPSTFQQEYSYAVDDTSSASWTPFLPISGVNITASDFQASGESHVFYLRARNRWGVISRDTSRAFTAVVPEFAEPGFPGRILFINNSPKLLTNIGTLPPSHPLVPDSNTVRAYYTDIMDSLGLTGKFDVYTVPYNNGNWPSRRAISQYSTIVLLVEQRLDYLGFGGVRYVVNATKQSLLREYLNVGGNLIVVGGVNMSGIISNYTTFADTVFHAPIGIENNTFDFAGAQGLLGYPNFVLDQSKPYPDPDSVVAGVIRGISINIHRGFGEPISLFNSNSNNPSFQNQPVGIRFIGIPPVAPGCRTYSVVYFGLPLYYVERSVAIQAMRKAFQDLNEL